MLIPFGRVQSGGEVVCEETGQVFRLNPGDILIFRSPRMTHYNRHFVGIRLSVVAQTDRTGSAWVENRNGYLSEVSTGLSADDTCTQPDMI